jgi:hypothetical protein
MTKGVSLGRFLVRNIQDLKWNPTAFDQVVIPDRHKHLLLSMIKGHNARRADQGMRNDIIEGKGKGLVTLLHGPPGVLVYPPNSCSPRHYR